MATLYSLDEREKALLGIVEGPIWPDHCKHDPGSYVASFECSYRTADGSWHDMRCDLYVWEQDHYPRCGSCIRNGDKPGDYYGNGIELLCQGRDHEPNMTAHAILQRLGHFTWKKDEEVTNEAESVHLSQ